MQLVLAAVANDRAENVESEANEAPLAGIATVAAKVFAPVVRELALSPVEIDLVVPAVSVVIEADLVSVATELFRLVLIELLATAFSAAAAAIAVAIDSSEVFAVAGFVPEASVSAVLDGASEVVAIDQGMALVLAVLEVVSIAPVAAPDIALLAGAIDLVVTFEVAPVVAGVFAAEEIVVAAVEALGSVDVAEPRLRPHQNPRLPNPPRHFQNRSPPPPPPHPPHPNHCHLQLQQTASADQVDSPRHRSTSWASQDRDWSWY